MQLPTLLWVDLRVDCSGFDLPQCPCSSWIVQRAVGAATVANAIEASEPRVLCFDYDYPDLRGLETMRQTKRRYPSLPILMLTQQHSEALAIWAFRAGVRDFMVKPVRSGELCAHLRALSELPFSGAAAASRCNLMPPPPVPVEVRYRRDSEANRKTLPAVSYIDLHFGERIRQRQVAELCGMEPCQFSRAFRREHGTTFQEFLLRYRINKATELLANPAIAVTDVALIVGFSDLSHFTRTFRRCVGLTPSGYRLKQA